MTYDITESDIQREDYTWRHAAKDLALTTPLTLLDASRLASELEGMIHPYDALPILSKLAANSIADPRSFGQNLLRLIKASEL